MSNQQPGPYGQPPQQPGNPYAQQQPQPGYGYPPQPPAPGKQQGQPQPGYGYPPQPGPPSPYGQPNPYAQPGQPGPHGRPGPYAQPGQSGPYAQGAPYGAPAGAPQPGMPAPEGKSGGGKGKVIGLSMGAVAVAGIVIGAWTVFGGNSGDVAPYRIVPPAKVLDGTYAKAGGGDDAARTKDLASDAKAKKVGIENGTGVDQTYTGPEKARIQLVGVYGDVSDPGKSAEAMLDLMHAQQREDRGGGGSKVTTETVEGPDKYSPDGFDGAVMKCEKQTQKGTTMGTAVEVTFSTCVWADTSAVAFVQQGGGAKPSMGGEKVVSADPMTPEELSEATAKVREEARQEK